MKELSNALGVTPRRINQILKRRLEAHGYTFGRNIIALDLAADNKIDVRKYASMEELEELRKLRQSKTVITPISLNKRREKPTSRPVVIRLEREFEVTCPNIPSSIIRDAKRMSEVYPYFYVFENSVRYFIKNTFESVYGQDWWERKVGSNTRRKAKNRQAKEGRNRWHGKRGRHPIFYVDIDDLRRIITSNYDDFKEKLPDVDRPIEWITNRIEEIELSRNIIAHNNPLSDDDINRIKIYFKDWVRQFAD